MKTLFTSRATFTVIVLFGLVGYNFMNASWTAPTGTAPAGNTEAPINTGSTAQVKLGGLSTGALVVNGNQTLTADGPRIKLDNTRVGTRDYWLYNQSNLFYILADRNDDGSWSGENPWPLQMFASTSPAGDYALFGNQVRATEYCDRAGGNCFEAADVGESELPGEDEVGSILLAVISYSAPTSNGSVLKYGDTILGRHLCPAGILMADTNDNDKISMIQSSGNVCDVTLTGVWRTLGYSFIHSTTLASNQNRTSATLFQKVSE